MASCTRGEGMHTTAREGARGKETKRPRDRDTQVHSCLVTLHASQPRAAGHHGRACFEMRARTQLPPPLSQPSVVICTSACVQRLRRAARPWRNREQDVPGTHLPRKVRRVGGEFCSVWSRLLVRNHRGEGRRWAERGGRRPVFLGE
jgi:hypothetical protein